MTNTAMPIFNPYASRQRRPLLHHEEKGGTAQVNSSMGRQSQHQKSAIKKALQFGQLSRKASQKIGHFDHRQRAVHNINQAAFHPLLRCSQCIAEAKGRKPHRGHHPRCPRNRKTRGQSAREVEIERESNRLHSIINRKMGDSGHERDLTGGTSITPSVASSFARIQLNKKSTVSPEQEVQGLSLDSFFNSTVLAGGADKEEMAMLPANSTTAEVALFLGKSVQKRKPSSLKCNASDAFVALTEEIMCQVKHKKPAKVSQELPVHVSSFREAQNRFHSIFGKNNFVYTVPEMTDLLEHSVDQHFMH
jgi:hypothetical protein